MPESQYIPRKLRPAVVAAPGLIVLAAACQMDTISTAKTGNSYHAECLSWPETRTTHAWFFNPNAQWIDQAYSAYAPCGSTTWTPGNVLAAPVLTTGMTRSFDSTPWENNFIFSDVIGASGYAHAQWQT
jgi:hypothetical protein